MMFLFFVVAVLVEALLGLRRQPLGSALVALPVPAPVPAGLGMGAFRGDVGKDFAVGHPARVFAVGRFVGIVRQVLPPTEN